MTIEAFLRLYADNEIHNSIHQCAKRHTRNIEFQKDLIQEAWLRLFTEPTGQRTIDWYCEEASKSIHSIWKTDYRRRKSEKSVAKYYEDFYSNRYE